MIITGGNKYRFVKNNPIKFVDYYGNLEEPPADWPEPFWDDAKWNPNGKNPEDVEHPGNYDQEGRRNTWHPKDEEHDFDHWDSLPPRGEKGRKRRYLEDGTEIDKDGVPINESPYSYYYDMIDDAYELPAGARELALLLIPILFSPKGGSCPAGAY